MNKIKYDYHKYPYCNNFILTGESKYRLMSRILDKISDIDCKIFILGIKSMKCHYNIIIASKNSHDNNKINNIFNDKGMHV